MDIRLYDNYEEDGQLSLFGFEDADYEMEVQPLPEMAEEAVPAAPVETLVSESGAIPVGSENVQKTEAGRGKAAESTEKKAVQRDMAGGAGLHLAPGGSGIRIRKCATCGKHLFVSEVSGGYASSCNNCGIEYFQKV